MNRINILISLLLILSGISVIDIKAAAKSTSTKRGRDDDGDDKGQKKPGEETGPKDKKIKVDQDVLKKMLFEAIEKYNFNQAQEALDLGANVNAIDYHSATSNSALTKAARKGNFKILKLLLDRGADVNLNVGETALIGASSIGHNNNVQLLIDRGAKVNEKDYLGTTALIYACSNGYANIVEILLKAGANIKLKGNSGRTALIDALEKKHTNVFKLLIQYGAEVSEKTFSDYIVGKPELEKILTEHKEKLANVLSNVCIDPISQIVIGYAMPEYKIDISKDKEKK